MWENKLISFYFQPIRLSELERRNFSVNINNFFGGGVGGGGGGEGTIAGFISVYCCYSCN